jgi:hypothetical protein
MSLPTFMLQSPAEEAAPQLVDMHINRLQVREGLRRATSVFSEHTRRRWEIDEEARRLAIGQPAATAVLAQRQVRLWRGVQGEFGLQLPSRPGLRSRE